MYLLSMKRLILVSIFLALAFNSQAGELTNKISETASDFISNLIPGEGWLNFVLKAGLFTIAYIPIMYALGMIEFEKELYRKPLQIIVIKLGQKLKS